MEIVPVGIVYDAICIDIPKGLVVFRCHGKDVAKLPLNYISRNDTITIDNLEGYLKATNNG